MKDSVMKRERLNNKIVTIREPKESVSFEEFIKGIGPIIKKMARKKK